MGKKKENNMTSLVDYTAKPGIRFALVLVDEATAKEYMSRVGRQRKLNQRRVTRYASTMKRGEWYDTGVPLIFGADGCFYDGQHRAQAVIDSGCPQWFLVVTGVGSEALLALDDNRARSAADVFHILGIPNGALKSAVIKSVYNHGSDLKNSSAVLAELQMSLRLYMRHRTAVDYVLRCASYTNQKPLTTEILATCVRAYEYGADPTYIKSFITQVTNGGTVPPDAPTESNMAWQLCRWVQKNLMSQEARKKLQIETRATPVPKGQAKRTVPHEITQRVEVALRAYLNDASHASLRLYKDIHAAQWQMGWAEVEEEIRAEKEEPESTGA